MAVDELSQAVTMKGETALNRTEEAKKLATNRLDREYNP